MLLIKQPGRKKKHKAMPPETVPCRLPTPPTAFHSEPEPSTNFRRPPPTHPKWIVPPTACVRFRSASHAYSAAPPGATARPAAWARQAGATGWSSAAWLGMQAGPRRPRGGPNQTPNLQRTAEVEGGALVYVILTCLGGEERHSSENQSIIFFGKPLGHNRPSPRGGSGQHTEI